jgi:hypothetical protein
MILIAHRGNINGVNEKLENSPTYVDSAINSGFHVEIDLRLVDGKLFLGHDNPDYLIDKNWIIERIDTLWIHAKNIETLEFLKDQIPASNFFWHDTDDATLTSSGFIWTYPGKQLTKYSVAVLPELCMFQNLSIAYGICSDKIYEFKDL